MRTLDANTAAAIAANEVWVVNLVSMQVGNTTYHISDHYRNLTVGTTTFLPNGRLLNIDNVANGTNITDDSVEISLAVIDATFRADILDADTIGGDVTIRRGLVDANTGNLVSTNVHTVYEGTIFQVSFGEEYPLELGGSVISQTAFTAVADVRAKTFLLEEAIGRYTNDTSNRRVDPTDRSMEFVPSFDGKNVRFGGS